MTQFEKRLAAVEAKAGAVGNAGFRLYVPPPGCADVPAWERACEAEAERDGAHSMIVRFVKPGDVLPVGPLQ